VFARYLLAVLVGVAVTVAWQSYRDMTKEDPLAATSAALDSVRQSVNNLSAEITKIRALEQDLLAKISALAASTRSRPSPAR
jgi:predicted negative regulator of RcsB-dependent stress response